MSQSNRQYDPTVRSGVPMGTKLYVVENWSAEIESGQLPAGELVTYTIVDEPIGHDGKSYFWDVKKDSDRSGSRIRINRSEYFFTKLEAYKSYFEEIYGSINYTADYVKRLVDRMKQLAVEHARVADLIKGELDNSITQERP